MEIVCFSDLHIHNYKQFDQEGSRLNNCLAILDDVFALAQSKSKIILFTGDLFDNQRMLPTIVVNQTVSRFDDLFRAYPEIKFYAISGNHDFATKNLYHEAGETALRHLDTLFERFVLLDNAGVILDDAYVVGVPYYEYSEDFKKALDRTARTVNGTDEGQSLFCILMQHQTPSGLDNPNIPIDIDVNDELYDNFDFIINGHIHTNARMFTDKFLNLGNPLHRDLGDEGEDKGFWILNTNHRKADFISTKGKYPEFRRVKINAGETFLKSDDDSDFYVVETVIIEKKEQEVNEEKFGSNLKAETLVQNFWETVDGQDQDLLKVGLSLLQ